MSIAAIYDRLNTVFQDIFDDERITVKAKTTADDIDDWDSLENIRLIAAVEDEFGIRFRPGELRSMQTVGDLASAIEKKDTLKDTSNERFY